MTFIAPPPINGLPRGLVFFRGQAVYSYPTAIELAPTGALAVVIDSYGDQVTLVNTSTHHAVRRINVGSYAVAVAIAP
jgi:hypothetical protein